MDKLEVQARVLQNGKPIDLDKFEWDEKSCTFSTIEDNLIIDFENIACCTFKTGWSCTFKTGNNCTFDTGNNCTFKTGWSCTFKTGNNCTFDTDIYCTFNTGDYCTFNTGDYCTFNTGDYCTFNTDSNCTFNTGWNCTFKTSWSCTFNTGGGCTFKTSWSCTFKTGDYCAFDTDIYCTFNTGSNCTFNTGSNCTFDTGSICTFNTGNNCTFKTGNNCTFKTGSNCTLDTGSNCTFNTGDNCTFDIWETGYFVNEYRSNIVITRNYSNYKIYELDNLPKDKFIKVDYERAVEKDILPFEYIDDGIYVIKNDRQVEDYTILNCQSIEDYFDDKDSNCYVAQLGTLYAHADSIKEAIEDVQFKHLQTKDVQEHITRVKEQGYITANDYRLLTGACRYGTNKWLEENGFTWEDKKSIDEVIELTKGQYGHDRLVELLKGE